MNQFLLFLISALACYRLSHMLAGELGPANIFRSIRQRFSPKTNIGKGIRCPLCWSVHVASWITTYLWLNDEITSIMTPIYWLAISGASVLFHKLDG